jgi:hypothetical protein
MLKQLNIKPHWLRSGILTVITVVFLIFIFGLIFLIFSGGECSEICTVGVCEKSFGVCFLYPLLVASIPVSWINSIIDLRIGVNKLIPFTALIFAFYFIAGSIIGPIVRKLKKIIQK